MFGRSETGPVGASLSPGEQVEGALRGHPDVLGVAVIGRPHAQWGEIVTAAVVVVPREGTTPDLEGVRDRLAPRIARYKVPRESILREQIPRESIPRADRPRAASGKVTCSGRKRAVKPARCEVRDR
ncbi:AMP-binding enzyme [Streptomyces narbonensis]|uniref:AMP-binding enzyme n=1 Tax=Streptomyces narbonensis TaxID=67333 RepID=UPI003F4D6EE8